MAKSKKAVAKKAAPKKTTAKKVVAKKVAPKKVAPKKAAVKKPAVKKAPAKKAAAKKVIFKKSAQSPRAAQVTGSPWAYINTDSTSGVPTYAESPNNSWAAIAVWMSLTTNPAFLPSTFGATIPDGKTALLASSLGITEECVKYIRNIAVDGTNEDLYNAFKTVANAFIQIGFGVNDDPIQPLDPPPYPPKQCLSIDDNVTGIAARMAWVKNIPPVRVIVPAGQ